MSRGRIAINAATFQASWLAIVLGAAHSRIGLILAGLAVALGLHLALSHTPMRELAGLAIVAAMGGAWDSVPVAFGWIEYPLQGPFAAAAPYWIVALWLAFATTLNVSLRWLRGRAFVAALLGCVAGPICYAAGEGLDALRLVDRFAALAAESLAWAVLLPVSVAIAARFDRSEGRLPTQSAHV